MDKLKAMTTFVEIAENGSLTKAAECLQTSLPTVVRILAALEERLGVRLFNRTTRRIALTQEGQVYYDRCRVILSDIEDAELTVSAQQDVAKGKLTVSAPALFGRLYVTPAASRFLENYSQVELHLILLDRVVNMIDEGVDVAVRIGHLDDSTLVAVAVSQVSQVLVANPEYLKKAGIPYNLEDLAHYRCIQVTGLTSNSRWRFRKGEKIVSIPVSGPLVCNRADAAIDACVMGLGIGLFMSYQVNRLIESGKLKRLLPQYEVPPIPVQVVYPHAKLLSTRARRFVDFMAAELKHEKLIP